MSKILKVAAKQNIKFSKITLKDETTHLGSLKEVKITLRAPNLRRSPRLINRLRNYADTWARRATIMTASEARIRRTLHKFLRRQSPLAICDYLNGKSVSTGSLLLEYETARGKYGFNYPLMLLTTELINKGEIIIVMECCETDNY